MYSAGRYINYCCISLVFIYQPVTAAMPVIKIDKNDFDTQVLSGYLVKSPPLTKRGMRVSVMSLFVIVLSSSLLL